MVKQLERHLARDRVVPSPQHVIAATCLRALTALALGRDRPPDHAARWFAQHNLATVYRLHASSYAAHHCYWICSEPHIICCAAHKLVNIPTSCCITCMLKADCCRFVSIIQVRPRTLALVASHATPQTPAALRRVAAGCSLRLLLRTRGPGTALRAALAAVAMEKSPGVRCMLRATQKLL